MRTDRIRSFVLVLGILVPTSPLLAADGDLDTSFSEDGKTTLAWGFTAEATSVAPLDDGSLLVGGSSKPASTAPWDFAVAKYLAGGTLDTDWGVDGKRSVTASSGGPTEELLLEIFADSSGRAALLGTTLVADPDYTIRLPFIARLTAAGDLDTTFGDGGTAIGEGQMPYIYTAGAARHLDGYLFYGSCFVCLDFGNAGVFLYRTGSLGHPDPQFGWEGWLYFEVGTGLASSAESVAVQPDGKIVMAWRATAESFVVQRLLPDGEPDPDFGTDGRRTYPTSGLNFWASDIAVDSNSGAIYVASSPLSGGHTGTIARLEPNGDFDTSFGLPDLDLEEGSDITTLAVTTDGKIVAAGRIDAYGDQPGGFFLARLLPSGAFDDSFDDNGVKRVEFDLAVNGVDAARGLALSGGKPVVVGYATQAGTQPPTSFAILRLANTHIFGDGLEVASTWQWSQAVQPAP